MENNRNIYAEMKPLKYSLLISLVMSFIIVWKLGSIEQDINRLQLLKEALEIHKDELQLSQQQLLALENLEKKAKKISLPTIYAITPTYWRHVQKAELTRLSQTLRLVPNLHWIVIEDSETKTDLEKRWKKHRGIEQRNAGLEWLRNTLTTNDKGIVYFMDDDNTYNVKVFEEMSKINKVGVWPVGLVGGLNAEAPVVENGKVVAYKSGWKVDRPFAIDMAGFAINLNLILTKTEAKFRYDVEKGLQESVFLSYFTTKDELEPLADNCTKVYVWHTRTETPTVNGKIQGLEV
ncbi:galactosylgalactosylxylosylprotein 3-beta-glucuronosyltransferase 2 isoform X2 [Aethina tumida]|uniref:galactosylgalactosylxylosylprotein 3-beta-glucuronosyltransferase 2 isoform X2 n=1 Tax=Aethina tumida TaxID=116153 RepID=UPI0021490B2D|nr:galactosylgalactosylxylosylprotein 3-beta-glucuronosyltransferase 2 isoform X2 [Aethina tumida]